MEESTFAISYSRLTLAAELFYGDRVGQGTPLINMIQCRGERKIYYFSLSNSSGHPQAISLQHLQGRSNPPKEKATLNQSNYCLAMQQ